jgi:outer membrane lipoprotein carrier protein
MRAVFATLVFAVLVSASPGGQSATVPSPADLAKRLQAHYNGVRDFKADFTSDYREGVILPKTSERGTVLVKKPGRMRWTYSAPDKKELVADGLRIYTYLVADRQVYVNPIPSGDDAPTALLFLMGKGDLLRDFTPSLAPQQPDGEWQLALTPKGPQVDFTSLTLMVDRPSLALRGFVTVDSQGGTSTFRFLHLQENVGLLDKQFDFSMPKGVEVIR